MLFRSPASILITLLLSVLLGCESDGVQKHRIKGEVTYQGAPVSIGMILFDPDVSQGNSGPQGFARIVDGRYDTSATGKGTVGGPHVVRISGFDGVATSDDAPMGSPVFPTYVQKVDLSKNTTTLDINVPTSKSPAAH